MAFLLEPSFGLRTVSEAADEEAHQDTLETSLSLLNENVSQLASLGHPRIETVYRVSCLTTILCTKSTRRLTHSKMLYIGQPSPLGRV